MTDLGMLDRMATHHSEMVRKHAYLVGLMSLAVQTGDSRLQESVKKQVAESELECDRCFSELRVLRQELLAPTEDACEDELAAAD